MFTYRANGDGTQSVYRSGIYMGDVWQAASGKWAADGSLAIHKTRSRAAQWLADTAKGRQIDETLSELAYLQKLQNG